MSLFFRKENAVEVTGRGGLIFIKETDEYDEQHVVTLSLRQFKEMINHASYVIEESDKEK